MKYTKYLMLTILLIIVVTGCSSDKKQAIKSGNDLTMFISTDIHYLANNLTDNGNAFQRYLTSGDGRQLNYIEEIVNAFVYDIKKKKPDILIISGDLTNNGEKESHLKLAEKLKDIENTTSTEIFVIPGNHDIQNPWARRFEGENQYRTDTIKADEFMKIYERFGFSEAISRDETTLSYLAAPSDDVWLLMLDTNEYDQNEKYGVPATNGKLGKETLDWIKVCSKLAQEKKAKIVTIMHHNLFNHSSVIRYGFTLDNSDEVYNVLQESNLNLVLSGHIHIQNIKSRSKEEKLTYDIVTSALCMYPEQYGVLKFKPDQGFEYETSKVDVEGWAKDTGVMEENLLHFTNYSRDYFTEESYQMAYNALKEVSGYTEEERELMAETVSLLNTEYFAGTSDMMKDEISLTKGAKLWRATNEPEFLRDYVNSIVQNITFDNNHLSIPIK